MRRIERLINLIAALLDTRRPLTAEEIRREIAGYDQADHENFRRTFERDKKDLRELGIPLETVKLGVFEDEGDGYVIPKERYYMPELDLAPDELAALRLVAGAVLGGADIAATGLSKLSFDAEDESWRAPRVVWGADVAAEQPLLGPLFDAVLGRKVLSFSYETADGNRSERTVEPYGLVHRRGHWYLVGRDRDRGAPRSFKVSRIVGAPSTTEGSYEIPGDFDIAAHTAVEPWEVGTDADATATIRFDAELAWWVEQNVAARSRVTDDGAVEVDIPMNNPEALASWLVGFGPRFEIVSPPEARAELLRYLQPHLGAGS